MNELISQTQIQQKIKEVARRLEHDYQGKELVIVMILKGAICLTADLIRELKLPLTFEAIQCSSYKGTSRGELSITGLERLQIKGKDVLVVDDIFDSGQTMTGVFKELGRLAPRSIKSCVLLRKKLDVSPKMSPDHFLFEIEDQFVVGYGLDYNELYRGLPSICIMN